MAMQIVSALFDDYNKAVNAVERLKRVGFTESEISIVGGDSAARNASSSTQLDDDASGAAKGATTEMWVCTTSNEVKSMRAPSSRDPARITRTGPACWSLPIEVEVSTVTSSPRSC